MNVTYKIYTLSVNFCVNVKSAWFLQQTEVLVNLIYIARKLHFIGELVTESPRMSFLRICTGNLINQCSSLQVENNPFFLQILFVSSLSF